MHKQQVISHWKNARVQPVAGVFDAHMHTQDQKYTFFVWGGGERSDMIMSMAA